MILEARKNISIKKKIEKKKGKKNRRKKEIKL